MPSIYDAASLLIYKVPNRYATKPIDLIQGIIERIHADSDLTVIDSTGTTVLRSDFKVDYYRQPSFTAQFATLKITLPVNIYDSNPLAWRHLDFLRKALLKKGVECNWAPCESNDRTTSCIYFITPTLPSTDLRLKEVSFRLAVLNTATTQIGVTPSRHLWLNDDRIGEGTVTGRITFNSPSEIDTLIKSRGINVEGRDGSKHLVAFQRDRNQLVVTSCTTIGLVISNNQAFDMNAYKAAINNILDVYNQSLPEDSTRASVDNLRTCPGLRFFFCDPSDILVANALCEYPMPGGEFFGTAYTLNQRHGTLLDPAARRYNRSKQKKYDQRIEDLGLQKGVLPPPSGNYEPYVDTWTRENSQIRVVCIQVTDLEKLEAEKRVLQRHLKVFEYEPEDVEDPDRDKLRVQLAKMQEKIDQLTAEEKNEEDKTEIEVKPKLLWESTRDNEIAKRKKGDQTEELVVKKAKTSRD